MQAVQKRRLLTMKILSIKTESVTKNSFVGRFKAHGIDVSRAIAGDEWAFIVVRQNGTVAASGEADSGLSLREAVHFAIRVAKLIRDEKA